MNSDQGCLFVLKINHNRSLSRACVSFGRKNSFCNLMHENIPYYLILLFRGCHHPHSCMKVFQSKMPHQDQGDHGEGALLVHVLFWPHFEPSAELFKILITGDKSSCLQRVICTIRKNGSGELDTLSHHMSCFKIC